MCGSFNLPEECFHHCSLLLSYFSADSTELEGVTNTGGVVEILGKSRLEWSPISCSWGPGPIYKWNQEDDLCCEEEGEKHVD